MSTVTCRDNRPASFGACATFFVALWANTRQTDDVAFVVTAHKGDVRLRLRGQTVYQV